MTIGRIHSFLVHPSKNEAVQPGIGGAQLPLVGKLFDMLGAIYATAEAECDIEIMFRHGPEGRQHNVCRTLVLQYLKNPTIGGGRALAGRLQSGTTHRSGLGLLFLLSGRDNRTHRLVLARFPADQGIVANERSRGLNVEFLERVFMKSAHTYKSAVYTGTSLATGFWDGRAIDKQIRGAKEISLYWIHDFLDSDLKATPAAATKRFAVGVRQAIRGADNSAVRNELISATYLIPNHDGRRSSPAQLAASLGLSADSQAAVREALPRPELFDEVFQLDATEFRAHVSYRVVDLDNGATLVGENERFDEIFTHEELPAEAGMVRYSTEGRVTNQILRQSK